MSETLFGLPVIQCDGVEEFTIEFGPVRIQRRVEKFPEEEIRQAIMRSVYFAIDCKGYVPCSMATATPNATVTEVLGVECYSKTDVFSQAVDDALLNGSATSKPVGLMG